LFYAKGEIIFTPTKICLIKPEPKATGKIFDGKTIESEDLRNVFSPSYCTK
jgi:hypothetical protein